MPLKRPITAVRHFLATEAAGGYVLIAAATLAMILANSPASDATARLLRTEIEGFSLLHAINDGLMAIFFLLVGLEIKRELLAGEMATWPDRILPGGAALAGMAVPAIVYLTINARVPENHAGWAIPAATDIAFALGVLALLGNRVPASLKLLLTAIAIIDDLGAIVIIAVAYTSDLALPDVALAVAGVAVLAGLNRFGVKSLLPYLFVGGFVWYEILLSGVHATLAGVVVAMTIPLHAGPDGIEHDTPLLRLEHALAPVVAFAIVPIFGFANAGVDLRGFNAGAILAPVPLGIALGLLIGKPVGIFGAMFALISSSHAAMPAECDWRQLFGLSVLCGIGFTMSLFIAGLAFGEGSAQDASAKIGILLGTICAAGAGYLVLSRRARGTDE